MTATIHIKDEKPFADMPFNVTITGLEINQCYKIEMQLDDYYCINAPLCLSPKLPWKSSAVFYSDQLGEINLANSKAISGSYQGISEMGLFFNARSIQTKNVKLPKQLEEVPLYDKFYVTIRIFQNKTLIREKTVERYYLNKDISYKDIYQQKFQGRLFFQPAQQKPAVIVLSGSDGRIEKAQNIAQLLANYGFTTLAIAYFGLDGLASHLEKIPLEIIEEARKYLVQSPYVTTDKIGIYGRSKGAEFALASQAYHPNCQAIALNSPSNIIYEGIKGKLPSKHSSWTINNKELPYQAFSYKDFFLKLFFKKDLPINPKSKMSVEKLSAPMLLLASQKDEVWRAKAASRELMDSYKGKEIEYNLYQETGHMLTVAYQPNQRYNNNWKGLLDDSVDSWQKTIAFFNKHLKNDKKISNE